MQVKPTTELNCIRLWQAPEAAKLEQAFYDARAKEVENVRQLLPSLLDSKSGGWKTLQFGKKLEPDNEHWPEYIGWLRMHFRDLVFRYGCDRYGNKLEKQARQIELRPGKDIRIRTGLNRFGSVRREGESAEKPASTSSRPR